MENGVGEVSFFPNPAAPEVDITATHPVYNSDCLYINPAKNVFAISDPPGITTFSRTLITELDKLLQTQAVENLEALVNEVNQNAVIEIGCDWHKNC